jgi:hypothetical protein
VTSVKIQNFSETTRRGVWVALWIVAIPLGLGAQEVVEIAWESEEVAEVAGSEASAAYNNALAGRPNEQPITIGTFEERVRYRLVTGYETALRRVREYEACHGLFAELGADPVQMLSSTIYLPARHDWELEVCSNWGVVAHTFVGEPQTRLCERFGRLDRFTAAMLLIHEALHHAGLGERPVDPNGPTSRQISRMVVRSCGL